MEDERRMKVGWNQVGRENEVSTVRGTMWKSERLESDHLTFLFALVCLGENRAKRPVVQFSPYFRSKCNR